MARKITFAAREANLGSLAVVPFKSLESGDDVGGRLVSERLALWIGAGGGVQVLDGRQLEREGGGRRRAPDAPSNAEADIALYGEVLKQFAIHENGVKETFEHTENRKTATRMLRERIVDAAAGLDRVKKRAQLEPPEAQSLVTGVLVPLADGRIEVHVRLADTGTLAVIATASAVVPRDWGIPQPVAPRDYSGLTALTGTAVVGFWFLIRAASG